MAEHEQQLLEAALSTLFLNPALDESVARALRYGEAPGPLSVLAQCDSDLAAATPELKRYLDVSAAVTEDVIATVSRHGWPSASRYPQHVLDAVWILMQHADAAAPARQELLNPAAPWAWEPGGSASVRPAGRPGEHAERRSAAVRHVRHRA